MRCCKERGERDLPIQARCGVAGGPQIWPRLNLQTTVQIYQPILSFRVILYIPTGGKKWGMQCVNWFVEVSPPDGSRTSGLEFNSRFGFRDIPSGIAKRRSQAMWLSVAYKYYSVIYNQL